MYVLLCKFILVTVQINIHSYSLFVVTRAKPSTSSSLKNHWSLLSLWFTYFLESTLFIYSSTTSTLFWYQFLHFLLTYSFTHQFFLFWFTTLLIHNSLSLFHSLLKTYLFHKSYHAVSLLPPGLPSRTLSARSLNIPYRVTTYVGKPSAIGQPTRPTQPFILQR